MKLRPRSPRWFALVVGAALFLCLLVMLVSMAHLRKLQRRADVRAFPQTTSPPAVKSQSSPETVGGHEAAGQERPADRVPEPPSAPLPASGQRRLTAEERDRLLSLLRDRSVAVEHRAVAADTLGRLREKEAFDALVHVLETKGEADILNYKAARALGNLGNERAVPVLSKVLADRGSDRHLRVICELALGTLASKEAVEALRAAQGDPDRLIRLKAVQALERTRDKANLGLAERALADPDPFVQARALDTLGALGDASTVPKINAILRSTQSDFLRIACLTALGTINQPEATTILREYAGSTNDLLRRNAETTLARLRTTNMTERKTP